MNTKHKHAELIKAWADGAEIQAHHDILGWLDATSPTWLSNCEYRIKPSFPVIDTKMTASYFKALFNGRNDSIYEALRILASHAIRRSVSDGQVMPMSTHEEIVQFRDEQIETLRAHAKSQGDRMSELRADRSEREKAIAEAVAHAYQHAAYTIAGPDAVDLAAIIAEVKP